MTPLADRLLTPESLERQRLIKIIGVKDVVALGKSLNEFGYQLQRGEAPSPLYLEALGKDLQKEHIRALIDARLEREHGYGAKGILDVLSYFDRIAQGRPHHDEPKTPAEIREWGINISFTAVHLFMPGEIRKVLEDR